MLKNYFIIGIRNILRYKVFSAINIFGLAISMSICLMLIMIVADQMSYDRFNSKHDRIYRINTERDDTNDLINLFATAPLPLASVIAEEYTHVEKAVRLRRGFGNSWIGINEDINVPLGGFFADPGVLDLFEYKLAYGDPETALTEPNSVVLTQKAVDKLFKIKNPVGEIITVGDLGDYKITGVIEDNGDKSHVVFEALASMSSVRKLEADSTLTTSIDSWRTSTLGWVYLQLKEGALVNEVEQDLAKINKAQYDDIPEMSYRFELQNLTDINPGPLLGNQIGPGMPIIFVYFLGGLALIIMLSSCFNYTNLSIARAMTRGKEVGIRKVSGAVRSEVFLQFVIEAVIISLLSLVLSFILLQFLKPAFQSLNFTSLLQWDLKLDIGVYVLAILFSVFIGLLAGALPAMVMSRFKPIQVLKDFQGIKLFSKVGLRKTLIVSQFVLSLVFILSAILIHNQLEMMVKADYGFDSENTVMVYLNDVDRETLTTELEKYPDLVSIAPTSHLPAAGTSYGMNIFKNLEDEAIETNYYAANHAYIENMGLTLLAGKNFPDNISGEDEKYLIINEKAVKAFHLANAFDAIGKTLYTEDSTEVQVIGVVKDFNHQMMMSEIGPLVLRHLPSEFNLLQVKTTGTDQAQSITHIEEAWAKVEPVKKIDHRLMSHEIKQFYDLLFGDLKAIVVLISFLAISIACLGLLGMATFTAQTRLKEISIRKILGASNTMVVFLLSKGFIKLLIIAIVMAIPLAYLVNSLWLEAIAYRVSFNAGVVSLGVFILVILGIATIGSQAIKASFTKPVDNLRNE